MFQLISSIALGTSIVLYDGSPIVPDYYRLWDLADEIGFEIMTRIHDRFVNVEFLASPFLVAVLVIYLHSKRRTQNRVLTINWKQFEPFFPLVHRCIAECSIMFTKILKQTSCSAPSLEALTSCKSFSILIMLLKTISFIRISSCFAGVNPTLSVHRGEIQSPHLAMAIECWSDDGKNFLTRTIIDC